MTIFGITAPTGVLDALERAAIGEPVSADDAELLLQCRGDDSERLFRLASRVRDDGLERAGRPGVITFSKKVFLPITNLCRDRCHYCIFVDTPGKLARKGKALYMSPEQIMAVARQGAVLGCKEALFTLGDRPEERWPDARAWLDEHGYTSTLHYVQEMAALVLAETGLLPHMNPGVMSYEEMLALRPFAPSMGMMLETTSDRLWSEPGQVHFGSPDKDPRIRLQVLEDAGLARIPLTTGILVGIGETERDRAESLVAIRESQARHGHIQETIVQNFRAKPATAAQNDDDLDAIEYAVTVAVARLVMGPDARIQAPPNLSDDAALAMLVRAGIDDWGGVSPLTADHVNPERPWPDLDRLREMTLATGFTLRERLTAHPEYLRGASTWIDPILLPRVTALLDPLTFLAEESARAVGSAPTPLRQLRVTPKNRVRDLIARAEQSPASLSDDDYATLLGAIGDDLDTLATLASDVRRYTVGEAVSIVANRNIDSTTFGVGLSLDDVAAITADAWALGATELCVQGTMPAELGATSYFELAARVKSAQPGMHLHAFRPADLADGIRRTGLSDVEFLRELRASGVDTIPGTGIKLLDEARRRAAAPDDLPTSRWSAIVRTAHGVGLRSTAVMVYGLGESASDRVAHLRALRAIQDETGGFTELVPMPALNHRMPAREHRAVHAVARLMLLGSIDHIQAPWTRLEHDQLTAVLQGGADDLGGTLFDGRVLPERGAEFGRELSILEARALTKAISRPLRQRTTTYGEPPDERKSAASRKPISA
ncbi:7,8-didemethyl-8-hydroxy-5-deazariboflavin synthase CofG [Salinibacterium sp.]|uniref:7,8-didemethyl-8-hydroxy-5-deazariboflavin synthase CofG n=1 Tax=Salinibacterium sp. TaxID=1915057 RepID=UPI00286AFADE|nr:7,8-didemethyl-8-hydroxy-5-deazariboflavin synthase CofG [Salinibacterium sp.]